jgi:4-hydroxy-4-methyl-2-oxoglutarate aldolase
VTVRPGDIVVGDIDGLVIVAQELAQKVLDAANARRVREAEMIEALQKGKTTIELLRLPALPNPK